MPTRIVSTSEKTKKNKKHLNQKSHKQPERSPVTVTAYEYPQNVHHVGRGKVQKESTSSNVMFQHLHLKLNKIMYLL